MELTIKAQAILAAYWQSSLDIQLSFGNRDSLATPEVAAAMAELVAHRLLCVEPLYESQHGGVSYRLTADGCMYIGDNLKSMKWIAEHGDFPTTAPRGRTIPEPDDREDGFECLAFHRGKWTHVKWDGRHFILGYGAPFILERSDPTAYAPLPPHPDSEEPDQFFKWK